MVDTIIPEVEKPRSRRRRAPKENQSNTPARSAVNKLRRATLVFGAGAVVLGGGGILAKKGWDSFWQEFRYGNPVSQMSSLAGVDGLNTCAIPGPDGVEVMLGATIDPDTGDARALTYARPGGNGEAIPAFSIDTVQERTDADGNVVTEEKKGDIIEIERNKDVKSTQIFAPNGSRIKEIKVVGSVVTPTEDGSRTIEATCTTAVAIGGR